MEPHGQAVIILICLGIGLVLWDLNTIQFDLGEGDDADDADDPSVHHLKGSALAWGHAQAILGTCQDIMEDIAICFPAEEDPQPPPKKILKAILQKQSPPRGRMTRRATAAAHL
jgi:nitrogen fixation-related uncharacterized protein